MKLLAVFLGVFVSLASSQCFSSIPECAQQCLLNAVAATTSCGSSDWPCQCTTEHQKVVHEGARNCITASCGQAMDYGTFQVYCCLGYDL